MQLHFRNIELCRVEIINDKMLIKVSLGAPNLSKANSPQILLNVVILDMLANLF